MTCSKHKLHVDIRNSKVFPLPIEEICDKHSFALEIFGSKKIDVHIRLIWEIVVCVGTECQYYESTDIPLIEYVTSRLFYSA